MFKNICWPVPLHCLKQITTLDFCSFSFLHTWMKECLRQYETNNFTRNNSILLNLNKVLTAKIAVSIALPNVITVKTNKSENNSFRLRVLIQKFKVYRRTCSALNFEEPMFLKNLKLLNRQKRSIVASLKWNRIWLAFVRGRCFYEEVNKSTQIIQKNSTYHVPMYFESHNFRRVFSLAIQRTASRQWWGFIWNT